ncbi:hypothetical protein K788_0005167 [Paraburkholderia caribensis MBA4]|uniref:Uncharacterized protein n=1 Tax=Paraburkholderia caribensis MBA4 TaxID=1323664 RepID=A0A0P0RFR2_9BURK|nr:hypothetical protein K788_0005167 [Paraburkholderia caribensis MBA4]
MRVSYAREARLASLDAFLYGKPGVRAGPWARRPRTRAVLRRTTNVPESIMLIRAA